ncbi:SDR family NAD(P)-dependent oxidoreductase [Paenibacillus glycanilyticus]|uniref:Short-chain dehydrogenase n=1 Tax=Paenibacillus glycanilyticus TaxID=126569 RepID=A0ABQ6GFV2_9BACL|nr:SDR family NAD(P)-dependent oxidoreductase [Paenibacillus glycanilyticus]GLX69360.1 short-chain dehydrogenase [Paenibacillus glycanilyticus]
MNNIPHKHRIAVVSGGTSGVGKKTAMDLAKNKVEVILLGRDKARGNRVRDDIIKESGNGNVTFYPIDLSSLDEIRGFRRVLEAKYEFIDILVSAAGVMFNELKLTREHHDQNFVVNYLSHFWLINELIPLLKQAEQGRVLIVGALPFFINHSKVELPTPTATDNGTKYSGLKVVGQSLVAKVLLTVALREQLKDTSVTVNMFHPGYVTDSNYGADSSWLAKRLGALAGLLLSKKNKPVGMELALDPKLAKVSGQLFNEKQQIVPLSAKYTKEKADELWAFSLNFAR